MGGLRRMRRVQPRGKALMSCTVIPNYRIFTDATADFAPGTLADLPRISVIPMEVAFDGRTYLCGAKGNLPVGRFYAMQREGGLASTSQINPHVYLAAFEEALQSGYDVLYLGFSSGMSGTLETARLCMEALRQRYPGRKLICVDTLCASVGEGLLVCGAVRRQYAGMPVDALAEWVVQNRLKVCHWFTVDGFEHLRRSGRIGAASAAVGGMLNIKPLLRVDDGGKLQVMKKPRGRKKAVAELIACMKRTWAPDISPFIAVGHSDNYDAALMLADAVARQFPQADPHMADIGPVIGAHTGPSMLALAYWGKNR